MSDKDRNDEMSADVNLSAILEEFDVDAFDEAWDSVQISPTPKKSTVAQQDDKTAFEDFNLDVDVSAEFTQAMLDGQIRDDDADVLALSLEPAEGQTVTTMSDEVDEESLSLDLPLDVDVEASSGSLELDTDKEALFVEAEDVEGEKISTAIEKSQDDAEDISEDSQWDSDLGEFSLELQAADEVHQELASSGESEDWEDVGEAFGVSVSDGEELSTAELQTKEEDEDDDADELEQTSEAKQGDVGLSLRARLGRVYPEGEIVEGTHDLSRDHYYSAALCRAVPDPREREHRRKRVLIAMMGCIIILGLLLTMGIIIHKIVSKRGLPVDFVQKYAFQLASQNWDVIAVSENGRWAGMCSDERGVLVHDSNVVAEFLPVASGCRGLSIDDEGAVLWYLDAKQRLYYLSPGDEFGFESHEGAVLSDMIGTEFTVSKGRVSYLAEIAGAREWRSLALNGQGESAISLPDDALLCKGSTPELLAYVSKDSIQLVHITLKEQGETQSASLDAPKLACPRALAIQCTVSGDDEWAVLCRDSVIQGKGATSMTPVRHEFTRLATGADMASLIRHADGTELLTSKEWLRISKNGNHEILPLSVQLDKSSHFLWRDIKSAPLIGLSNGCLSQISLQAAVSVQTLMQERQLLGAAFVGDGSHAIVVIDADLAKASGSRLALWDLSAAAIVESQVLDGTVTSINVSERGNYGFVLSELKGERHLTWLQWQTGNRLGTFKLDAELVDASWSGDERHVWLSYDDGRKVLFVRDEGEVKLLRTYGAEVALAFQQNEYMWKVSSNRVELERLADGQLSVVIDKLSKALAGAKIDGVTSAIHSDFVLFWGGGGLWSYDTRRDVIEKLAKQPVTWAQLDRAGEVLASNLGIVNLFSKLEHPHAYDENHEPLFWTGDGLYLQTEAGDVFYRVGTEDVLERHARSKGLSYIGSHSGVHPASNLTLSLRGDLISLEELLPDTTHIRAAFSGADVHSWCWMLPNGATQGRGSTCVPINQSAEDAVVILSNNQDVTQVMKDVKLQRVALDYSPVELSFNKHTQISITTEPDGAWLVFASSEGELPKALQAEDLLEKSPFVTSMERDERWFAIVVSAVDYVSRTVIFQPIYEHFERHIELLPEAYEDIELKLYFEASEGEIERELELSDDFEVALKTAFGKEREAIHACLAEEMTDKPLLFKLSETCDFEFSAFTDADCGDDVVSNLSDTFNCASNAEIAAVRGATIRVQY